MTTQTTFTKEQKKELRNIIQKELKPIHTKLNILGGLEEHAKSSNQRFVGLEEHAKTMNTRLGGLEEHAKTMNTRLGGLEEHAKTTNKRLNSLEKNVERLNYVVTDHTSRLERIEERLNKTLTKDFFLEYMDAFIAKMDHQHHEIQALHLGSQRHDNAIEKLETTSKRHSKEISSITFRIQQK